MVRIPRTEQTVKTSGQPLPYSTGSGYSAVGQAMQGLGKGIASLGSDLGAESNKEADYHDNMEMTRFINDVDMLRIKSQNEFAGDPETYQQDFMGQVQQRRAELNLSPRGQLRHGPQLERYIGNVNENATQFQYGKIKERQVAGVSAQITQLTGQLQPETLLEDLPRHLTMVDSMVDQLPGISEEARHRLRTQTAANIRDALALKAGSATDLYVGAKKMVEDWAGRGQKTAPATQGGNLTIQDYDKYPAPSRGKRSSAVNSVVVHYTAGTTLEGATSHGSQAGTGYHYYIDRDGGVYRWVPDDQRIVHIQDPGKRARNGKWPEITNDSSIGVSFVARNDADVTDQQRSAARKLIFQLVADHGINIKNVVGHGDIQGGHSFGNRGLDEGTALAAEFRDGRAVLDAKPSSPTRVAGANLTMTDAAGSTRSTTAKGPDGQIVQLAKPSVQSTLMELLLHDLPKLEDGARRELITAISKYETMAKAGDQPPENDLAALAKRVEAFGNPDITAAFNSTFSYARAMAYERARRPEEVEAELLQLRSDMAQKGATPELKRRVDNLGVLLEHMRKGINDNPLEWANRTGVRQVPPLQFDNPASWEQRLDEALATAQYYGQKPTFFLPNDRGVLADQIKQGGGKMAQTFRQIIQHWGPDYGLSAILEVAKDKPEGAALGWLMARGGSDAAAVDLVKAMDMRAAPGFKSVAPKATDYLPVFQDVTGSLYAGKNEQTAQALIQAANLLYEVRGRNEAAFNRDIWAAGLRQLMGEREVGGEKFGGTVAQGWRKPGNFLPWPFNPGEPGKAYFSGGTPIVLPPHVNQNRWREIMENLTEQDLMQAGLGIPMGANNLPIDMKVVRNATLVQRGDGRYALATGDAETPGKERFALWSMPDIEGLGVSDSFGARPYDRHAPMLFIVDFYKLAPVMRQRLPGVFDGGPMDVTPAIGSAAALKAPAEPTSSAIEPAQKSETVIPPEPKPAVKSGLNGKRPPASGMAIIPGPP